MKKSLFVILFLGFCFLVSAQNQPEIGDELVIKEQNAQTYKYIDFPRLNILVKRGKLANYKSVHDTTVVVDEVVTNDDGSIDVILKKKDGSKFFGILSKVKANYDKAIESNEIASLD